MICWSWMKKMSRPMKDKRDTTGGKIYVLREADRLTPNAEEFCGRGHIVVGEAISLTGHVGERAGGRRRPLQHSALPVDLQSARAPLRLKRDRRRWSD